MSTRLWAIAVDRWQLTLTVFGLLVGLGVAALFTIPRSEDPTFPIPGVTLTIFYPGATPSDVERVIVRPVEEAVGALEDVRTLDSSAYDGLASIHVELEYGGDTGKRQDEVIRQFNLIRANLPADVEIDVRKDSLGAVNIVVVGLVSDTAAYADLERLAKELRNLIANVPGVRRAETLALPRSEIRIAVNVERLAATGVSLRELTEALQGQSENFPGGAVNVGLRRFNLQTGSSYRSLEQIENTAVHQSGGRIARVGDVASVGWSTEEQVYTGRFSGHRAVFVTASQKDQQNIFAVREGIYDRLAEFEAHLPPGVHLERGFDQSRNVARRLHTLTRDFLIALALVAATLLPLGLRAAGVVMISVPLSLAIGLAGLTVAGLGLNQLSIAGLVVALGLLVDDSIVVVENISRFLRKGYPPSVAAIRATDQIAPPVIGCTATMALGFVPLLFLPASAGEFIRSLPAAVLFTVLASLLVSVTVIPFLASRVLVPLATQSAPTLLRRSAARLDALAGSVLRTVLRAISRTYTPALRAVLARPKATLLVTAALCTVTLTTVPLIGFSLFPAADTPHFLIRVLAPNGASVAATDTALRYVEAELARHREVKQWFTNVGHGSPYVYYNVFPEGTLPNMGEIVVELKEYDPRLTPTLYAALRKRFSGYAAAEISVVEYENGPPIDAPIAIRVVGPELAELRRIAARVERTLRGMPGIRDVHNPVRLMRTDINLGIDEDKAALFGVSPIEARHAVRLAIAGSNVGVLRRSDGTDVPIVLRLPMTASPTLEQLATLAVWSTSGQQVPLAQITAPRFEATMSEIDHFNRERVVTLSGYTQEGYNTDAVATAALARLHQLTMPAGYRLVPAGEMEAGAESFGGILPASLIAAFGILAILVYEFGNFRSTLVVIGVVPLGVSGALLALLLTRYSLSFTAALGMIALVGIEIKNSILLVDFTNRLRSQGFGLDAAIERAGEVRFLPILLTSITAICSLTPLAVERSGLYSPLAVVIIGGLTTSTLLGRLVTPLIYKLVAPAGVPSAEFQERSPVFDSPDASDVGSDVR